MDRQLALQRTIEERAGEARDAAFADRLCITRVGELVNLDFYGDPADVSFGDLLQALTDPEAANSVASLDLRGPDVGANGTRRRANVAGSNPKGSDAGKGIACVK
jgi:hypothetical protein